MHAWYIPYTIKRASLSSLTSPTAEQVKRVSFSSSVTFKVTTDILGEMTVRSIWKSLCTFANTPGTDRDNAGESKCSRNVHVIIWPWITEQVSVWPESSGINTSPLPGSSRNTLPDSTEKTPSYYQSPYQWARPSLPLEEAAAARNSIKATEQNIANWLVSSSTLAIVQSQHAYIDHSSAGGRSQAQCN